MKPCGAVGAVEGETGIVVAKVTMGNIGQWQGMNSGLNPEDLPSNVMSRTMNTTSRGGIVKTRPGFKSIFNAPNG